MANIRRINFLAGPGAGKSTATARIFSELKLRHKSVEIVTEYAKKWAYIKRPICVWDQTLFLGKQMHSECVCLNNGYNQVITDSPLILNYLYTKMYFPKENEISESVKQLVLKFEEAYPSLNIFLNRNEKVYDPQGRYQTLEQAKEIDNLVKNAFVECTFKGTSLYDFDYNDYEGITKFIISKL